MMKNKKYVKINWESNELSYAGEKDFQKWKKKYEGCAINNGEEMSPIYLVD